MRHTLTAALFAVLVPAAALAQTAATKPPVPHDQVLSANPFGVIVKWVNAEYERKIGPATTLGVSASHFADLDQSNAALLLRWYPQQSALDGFYLGARAGAHRFKTRTYDFYPTYSSSTINQPRPTYHEQTSVLPGVGVEIGYNWLLGPRQNVSVGVGFGLTRVFGGGDLYDMPSVLPALRLVNVGIAF
jgi:hypothetical protein